MACLINELTKELNRIISNNPKKFGPAFGVYVNKLTDIKKSMAKVQSSTATPNFDSLPEYNPAVKTMTYAGIGSRKTPAAVLELMTKAAKWLEGKGYKLQTGKTFGNKEEGADKAFSEGTQHKELFGPESATDVTKAIAKELHPAPKFLKEGGLKLMARNTNQIFGKNLDAPVDFVLFYAEETKNPLRPKGGTGQAVEMARRKGIPTINMANKEWRKELTDVLKATKNSTPAAKDLKTNNALDAGEIYYDVEMSPEALTEVTGFNDKYIKDNKVKLEESDTFEYDPDTGVIQVDKSVPEAEYQTLLKHELLHHLTYENITKNLSKKAKDKLIAEAQNVRDYIEDKFGTTLEGNTAYQRLNYALEQVKSRGKDIQVAEIVAIVGAEKQIRDMLSDIANTSTLEALIKRLLNSVMELLGNDKKAAESAKYVLDGVDQIIKSSKQTSELDTTKQMQGTIHLKDRAKVEAKYLEKLENC